MGSRSAGVLLYRRDPDGVRILVGHMGGPFHMRKHAGAWTIPKGEYADDETPMAAARREFLEELGLPVPSGPWQALGVVRQAGGKAVHVWAVEGDLDPDTATLGTFEIEWPPRSGRKRTFPELDRIAWLPIAEARGLLVRAQATFLDRLEALLADDGRPVSFPSAATPATSPDPAGEE